MAPAPFARGTQALATAAALTVTAGALAGAGVRAFGGGPWPLSLASNFPLHAFAACVLAGILAAAARRSAVALAALVAAAVQMHALHAGVPAMRASAADAGNATIRVAALNLLSVNHEVGRVVDWSRRANADVLVLSEARRHWPAAMNRIAPDMKHRWNPAHRRAATGIRVLSRHPLGRPREGRPFAGTGVRAVALRVLAPTPFLLVAAHPESPTSPRDAARRNDSLRRIADFLAGYEGRVVLAGDLNATPWTPHLAEAAAEAGLSRAPTGPTWPAPLGRLGIPIDHVMGRGFRLVSARSGPGVGSDHLPVVVDLAPSDSRSGHPTDGEAEKPSGT